MLKVRCEVQEKWIPKRDCLYDRGLTQPNSKTCFQCQYHNTFAPRSSDPKQISLKGKERSLRKSLKADTAGQLKRYEPYSYTRRRYFDFLKMFANEWFRRKCSKIEEINQEVEDLSRELKTISLPVRKAIHPEDPEYPLAMKRLKLKKDISGLKDKRGNLLDRIHKKFGFEYPEILFDEHGKLIVIDDGWGKRFQETMFFGDEEVIKVLPYKAPRFIKDPKNPNREKMISNIMDDLEPDSRTGKPRYLRVIIDTKQTQETIFDTLKKVLAPFRKSDSRLRETPVDEEVLKRKARGKSDYRIAKEFGMKGHPSIESKATRRSEEERKSDQRIYSRIKRASHKRHKVV